MNATRTLLVFATLAAPLAVAQRGAKMVWSDEFDGPAGAPPDSRKWTYDLGKNNGWGNGELETYTDRTANVSLDGEGRLAIRALKTGLDYTSGRIKTKDKFEFLYGRIDGRIKIPSGNGLWPAFWMLGKNFGDGNWPDCGEIDVMENVGKEPSTIHGTIHGPGYSGGEGISGSYQLPGGVPFSADFHVFSADWSPDSIRFLVDGREYRRITRADLPPGARWVYDHPFFVLLNVAVGGHWPGPPQPSTVFPQTMLVDWVHVWQAPAVASNPVPHRRRR